MGKQTKKNYDSLFSPQFFFFFFFLRKFLENLNAIVPEVDDNDETVFRDADAARTVKFSGPCALPSEALDKSSGRRENLAKDKILSLGLCYEFLINRKMTPRQRTSIAAVLFDNVKLFMARN